MNFRPHRQEPPELNLIPMIDVLIVLLIFLVLTTTFSRAAQLHIRLPEAAGTGEPASAAMTGLRILISPQGQYRINEQALPDTRLATVKHALKDAAGDNPAPLLTIDADLSSPHQAVITVLDAAAQLGYQQVSFMAESGPAR